MPTMDLARNTIQSMGGATHELADVNTYCRHLAHFVMIALCFSQYNNFFFFPAAIIYSPL